jgi:serine/threonine-protein kinase RsbW
VHGNKEDPYKWVHITLRCSINGEVTIAIRDEGAGFDIGSVPDPTTPEHLLSRHGRGIFLMRALMDEVSFASGGTVVHMRKAPNYMLSPDHRQALSETAARLLSGAHSFS